MKMILIQGILMAGILAMGSAEEHGPKAFPEARWQTATPESQGYDAVRLEAAIEHLEQVVGKDGVSQVMVVSNGYVLWSGDDIDNQHIVYSCTKSFTSTCLGLLWDDGKCSPSDRVAKHLPQLAERYPEVTLEHLATFTSGMHVDRGSLEPRAPDYELGAAMHYSSQTDILALALTKIAGEPLQDLFHRRIGSVIGINPDAFEWKSAHTVDGMRINGGAGMPESGVYTNATNMARFGWLYANDGAWNGQQLISKRYIDYATSVRVPASTPPHDPKGWYAEVLPGRYGLNWWVNGRDKHGVKLWPHLSGQAFAAQGNKNNICIIEPERNLVLVRLALDKNIEVSEYDVFFEALLEGEH